jgi:pimeloyl-ACP methyl ester carboxylesterase
MKLTVSSPAGRLQGQITGAGPVVVLQHGLCGDAGQPVEAFPQGQGYAHAVLNCRGHGDSPAGKVEALTIAHFTDDLAQMIDALPSVPVAVGGISMGAAMALRLAVTRPDLVRALILSRPAWGVEAAPANMQPNAVVGRMIAAGLGVEDFVATPTAQHLARVAPDNLASLTGFFGRQPLDVTAALLMRISADGPGVSEADVRALSIPTLIMASEEDAIHPMAHAQTLAGLIPGAKLTELPPKGRDKAAHIAACHQAILTFLKGLPQ